MNKVNGICLCVLLCLTGGTHRPVWKGRTGKEKFVSFPGVIDDFAAWYRALTDAEVRMLYDLAITKQLNASQVDRLFRDRP